MRVGRGGATDSASEGTRVSVRRNIAVNVAARVRFALIALAIRHTREWLKSLTVHDVTAKLNF